VSRTFVGIVAIGSGLWALALYLGYGQSIDIGSVHISSRNPWRPLGIFALALAAYVWISGRAALDADARHVAFALQAVTDGVHRAFARMERVDGRMIALLLVVAALSFAMRFRESTAGGSDAYSYVTQADLWLERVPRLRIEMPIATVAPWPNAFGTFVPFGYRATVDRRAIVPVTAPGLSIIMALFKAIAGHCAMFIVVPLTAGLLVWATFDIGRRLGSQALGIGAAWLTVTSPTFLMMSHSIMSDVPAAAFWALAIAFMLRRSTAACFAAGLSAAMAILVRSNLLPIVLVMFVWTRWRARQDDRRRGWAAPTLFALGVLPGLLAIAFVNRWVYGAASASGYGALSGLFAADNIPINVRHYTVWLAETQTVLVLGGLAALLVPLRTLWPTPAIRAGAALLAGVTLVVIGLYLAYIPFDDWWYLRFLLPAWPAMFIGLVALVRAPSAAFPQLPWLRLIAVVVVIALGCRGLQKAGELGVYPANEGERRYATIAELVARATEPNAAIITTAHVGPLRYYAGRVTVRYDVLDPAWLDRAVEWLRAVGRHPYILVEEQEVEEFRTRFAARNRLGRLDLSPILTYEAYQIPGRVYLFDPQNRSAETWRPAPIPDPQPRCPEKGDRPQFAIMNTR
jgi:hypothetical protein